MAARYALYFAPAPDSALGRFGAQWLGRDAVTGAVLAQPAVAGLAPGHLAALTAAPRRYGFHATLKPPMRLRPGLTVSQLHQALADFAATTASFAAAPLQLHCLDGFLALVLRQPDARLQALAAACVTEFDAFRTPPDEDELARRRSAGLSIRQQALLDRWGYPYVLDQFRFHLTLTQRLAPADRAVLEPALATLAEPLCRAPLAIDAIALFVEPEPGAELRLEARIPLAGP